MKLLTFLLLTLQAGISTADDVVSSVELPSTPKPNPKLSTEQDPDPKSVCLARGWTKKACKATKCCMWVKVPSKLSPNCYPELPCKQGEDYEWLDTEVPDGFFEEEESSLKELASE